MRLVDLSMTVEECESAPFAKDEYYFVGQSRTEIRETAWGGGGLVWSGTVGGCGKCTRLRFFIGTEDEEKATPPLDDSECC